MIVITKEYCCDICGTVIKGQRSRLSEYEHLDEPETFLACDFCRNNPKFISIIREKETENGGKTD